MRYGYGVVKYILTLIWVRTVPGEASMETTCLLGGLAPEIAALVRLEKSVHHELPIHAPLRDVRFIMPVTVEAVYG